MTVPGKKRGIWRISAVPQHYAWGRNAAESEVASLLDSSGEKIDESLPYAELWMGTHPSGPSVVLEDFLTGQCAGLPLKEAISLKGEVMGGLSVDSINQHCDLPFLFKVLSVKTALSIQSHPDKRLAEKLHKAQPDQYKDANHKPEMAIALSDFEALCGFCAEQEISETLGSVPEFAECCGEKLVGKYLHSNREGKAAALKEIFTCLMTMENDQASTLVKKLIVRLEKEMEHRPLTKKELLALRLDQQYPSDIGVLSSFLLNYVCLENGQAIALGPNEPHAYLSGEIVECMATSDNVIRAGLTPKYKDTNVLCSSLTYKQGKPAVISGECFQSGKAKLYRPDFDEFEVWRLHFKDDDELMLPSAGGPIIAFCQMGDCLMKWDDQELVLSKGTTVFIPADTPVLLSTKDAVNIWAASVNKKGWW